MLRPLRKSRLRWNVTWKWTWAWAWKVGQRTVHCQVGLDVGGVFLVLYPNFSCSTATLRQSEYIQVSWKSKQRPIAYRQLSCWSSSLNTHVLYRQQPSQPPLGIFVHAGKLRASRSRPETPALIPPVKNSSWCTSVQALYVCPRRCEKASDSVSAGLQRQIIADPRYVRGLKT